MTCTLEQVTIQLNPTIEKFEEELCELIQEDSMSTAGKASYGSQGVSIVERRLLVRVDTYGFLLGEN